MKGRFECTEPLFLTPEDAGDEGFQLGRRWKVKENAELNPQKLIFRHETELWVLVILKYFSTLWRGTLGEKQYKVSLY